MPWKVLGKKWHLARKGFPPGKKVAWPQETLEELLETLASVANGRLAAEAASPNGDGGANGEGAAGGQFLWNNQQVIHLMVPGQRVPWATVHSKRTVGVDLSLHGPAGAFATGRVAGLGVKQLVQPGSEGYDAVKLRFITPEDITRGDLLKFLGEHLEAVRAVAK